MFKHMLPIQSKWTRTTWLGATLAAPGLLLLTGAALGIDYDTRRAALGKLTYEVSCAICHGPSGRGNGIVASALTVPAPDLTLLQQRHGGSFPESYVTEVVTGGAAVTVHGGQMPAWGLLFLKNPDGVSVQRRIADVVEYIKSIQVR